MEAAIAGKPRPREAAFSDSKNMFRTSCWTLILALTLIGQCRPEKPSFYFRLTTEGLEKLGKTAAQMMVSMVKSMPIPDQNVTLSYTDLQLMNISVISLNRPTIQFKMAPPDGLGVTVSTQAIDVRTQFKASKSTLFGAQTDAGELSLHINSFKVDLAGKFGQRLDNGLPSFADVQCEAALGSANLHLSGAPQQFVVDMLSSASLILRKGVQMGVCMMANKLAGDAGNNYLASIQDTVRLGSTMGMRYSVQPTVSNEFVEFGVTLDVQDSRYL